MRALILDLARAFLDGFDRTAGRRDPVDEHAEQAREVLAEQDVPGPRRTTAPYDPADENNGEWPEYALVTTYDGTRWRCPRHDAHIPGTAGATVRCSQCRPEEQPIPEWEIDPIGDSDREALAAKLRKAWFRTSRWLDVADVAIAELDSRANVPAPRDREAAVETAARVIRGHRFDGIVTSGRAPTLALCRCGWSSELGIHHVHVAEQLAAVGALGNLTKEGP